MDYLTGVILAIVVGFSASFAGLDRDRAFYPVVMIVIALYYVLFAFMAGSVSAVLAESVVMVAFVTVAILGFKRSLWLVVVALAAHGIFDIAHDRVLVNEGVPEWWPGFCLAYDVMAAGFLGFLLLRRKAES